MTPSTPVLDYTADNPLVGNPAFLGYKVDWKTGRMFWKVCSWCESKDAVEAEALRLKLEITHAICPRCYAQQVAAITGDSL